MNANEIEQLRELADAAIAEEKRLRDDEDARVEAFAETGEGDISSPMDDWHDFDDIPPAHLAWYSAASPTAIKPLLDAHARPLRERDAAREHGDALATVVHRFLYDDHKGGDLDELYAALAKYCESEGWNGPAGRWATDATVPPK